MRFARLGRRTPRAIWSGEYRFAGQPTLLAIRFSMPLPFPPSGHSSSTAGTNGKNPLSVAAKSNKRPVECLKGGRDDVASTDSRCSRRSCRRRRTKRGSGAANDDEDDHGVSSLADAATPSSIGHTADLLRLPPRLHRRRRSSLLLQKVCSF